MRIVFMGTPEIAAGVLKSLIESGDHEVVAVYTQPDRPQGRKMVLTPSSVKCLALEAKIPVYQPERLKSESPYDRIRDLAPDVIVVAAYGQILTSELLSLPPYGCLNVHASLLPRYRGAAPIQWAIVSGDKVSGVTIMQMDEGLDTGDILKQEAIPLSEDETGDSLYDKLTKIGGPLLLAALKDLEEGRITPVPQDDSQATYVKKMTRQTGKISFSEGADAIERRIRGLTSWPGCWCETAGGKLKLWQAQVIEDGALEAEERDLAEGTLFERGGWPYVKCQKGCLKLIEVQPEGKKRMSGNSFLNGNKGWLMQRFS